MVTSDWGKDNAQMSSDRVFDVAIVGGGPAGLTASMYLARFKRSVVVLEAGDARAALIPMSRNCPGFPEGIAGEDLLRRLRHQALTYGAEIIHAVVKTIDARDGAFALSTASGTVEALFVILATGIVDKVPAIAGLREGISGGSIGLCPVCDGYEATGKKIGVMGQGQGALKEALFLRTYSSHVFMLANFPGDVGEAVRNQAADAGIEIWDTVADVAVDATGLDVAMADGSARQLDMLYPAMGCDVRSELAADIGADCDDKGFILVNAHQETSVPGLYAIGDVVQALNQMAVGFGHAALAAAHIHNTMRKRSPPVRSGIPA